MAKKKVSAKKSQNKSIKKAVVKVSSKTKKASKKVTKAPTSAKKTAAKKKTAAVAPKKAISKKSSTKPAATAKAKAVKKAVEKKAAKKPVKKTVNKTPAAAHLTKNTPVAKKLDLSSFVTPLDDRLLVQSSSVERKTPGGLYIPDTVADNSGNKEGVVVAVGRGHMNKKGHVRLMDVKVGDRIVFSHYAGDKITIQNEDLIILRESDVMGVVSK